MSSVGLIINDRSDRSASLVEDLLYVSQRFSSVRTAVLNGIEGLDKTLNEMGRKGVETLIIGGGDGTLQAAFTDSINNARFERPPQYVALPCGMTNVIANDCGLRGAPVESLDNFLWRRARGDVKPVSRHLLSLKNGDMDPIYGFFFGAGAFHSAVQFSRKEIQSRGAKRSLALVSSVFGYIWKLATDTENTAEPVDLAIEDCAVDEQIAQKCQLLFLATTLHKLGSGIYPFWGQGDAPMAVTTIGYPTPRFLRASSRLMWSKSRPWFSDYGYHSWKDRKLVTRFDGPFVFDGEIFSASGDAPVVFDTSREAHFLC